LEFGKGYPEYNPDEARSETGEWTSGGGIASGMAIRRGSALATAIGIAIRRKRLAQAANREMIAAGVSPADRGTVNASINRSIESYDKQFVRGLAVNMAKVWAVVFISAILLAVASAHVPAMTDALGRSIGQALKLLI